jgi:hypothetical protein
LGLGFEVAAAGGRGMVGILISPGGKGREGSSSNPKMNEDFGFGFRGRAGYWMEYGLYLLVLGSLNFFSNYTILLRRHS